MDTETIAKSINIFNSVVLYTLAVVAVVGIAALVSKKVAQFFRPRLMSRTLCFAALLAFAVEFTYFNYQYYLRFFSGARVATTNRTSEDGQAVYTTEGTLAEFATLKREDTNQPVGVVTFRDLNRVVTSVHIDVEFDDAMEIVIVRQDEESTRNFAHTLRKHFPKDNYVPVQSTGKVTYMQVVFPIDENRPMLQVNSIKINEPIPFYFSGVRLITLLFMCFVLLVMINKDCRAKMSYLLFDKKFDPSNKKQNYAYAAVVLLLLLFTWICTYTSVNEEQLKFHREGGFAGSWGQYNVHLVDAIIAGRTWLDVGNPQKLLSVQRPYDITYLEENGYVRDVDWMWDHVWYKGKHYSSYGIVPAIVLFVPYKLITGGYLSNHAGTFVFTAIGLILIALMWRYCVKKYMPNARLAFYIFGILALFFVGGLYNNVRAPSFYVIMRTAALMFTAAGVLLLLKSVDGEKLKKVKLFFACLCLALVVGCRPNMVFVSLLVPIVLWDRLWKQKQWKLLLFISIPYIMVAIPLMWYNYVRFDSVTEFGSRYVLTSVNNFAASHLLNPVSHIFRVVNTIGHYLIMPARYILEFPFVTHLPRMSWILQGISTHSQTSIGLINFPILFCVFYMFKNIMRKETSKIFNALLSSVIIAIIMLVALSYLNGVHGTYIIDFIMFLIFPALFCAYYWSNEKSRSELENKRTLKAVYILFAVSIFIGAFIFADGGTGQNHNDPILYRYLEHSFGFFRMS